MRNPGARLRSLAARVFSAATMERVIDPWLADLEHEHAHAIGRRHRLRRALILIEAYFAFWKVVGRLGIGWATVALRSWAAAHDRAMARVLRLVAIVTVALVIVDNLTYLSYTNRLLASRPSAAARAMLFLVPQALPFAVSAGLLAGIVCGLRGRVVTNRIRVAALTTSVIGAAAIFVAICWVVPAANQSFRLAVSGIPPLSTSPKAQQN